jgi:hypothetical protein
MAAAESRVRCVLASLAIGTGIGWYSTSGSIPIPVKLLPRGITVGMQVRF